ncbi:MAG: insulinase family protein [Fluviicola sp.]|nr:insulinase family protein [Fluviicola sp.]
MKKLITIVCAITVSFGTFAQKLDRSIKPTAGPAPEIKLGDIESFTLENGLKVFVVENHKLPKVAYSMTLDMDPILEGKMAGYVSATGELLGRGTANRSKQEIDQEIDFIGATLSTYSTGIYAASLKKHQDKLLAIMADVLMNADFKQDELDKIKKQTISGLESEKSNPDAIAGNVKSVLLYGKEHPYGELTTAETVENITLEKCKSHYKTYFRPNIAYMAVVGDITVEEVKAKMEKYFGAWEKGNVPSHAYETPDDRTQTTVAFVHKEGSTQSSINITHPMDLTNNNPDVVAMKILNSILGGSSTARLFMNLREGHGYTYGAYSRIHPDELIGNFTASAKVRNEVTDSSLVEFFVELKRIINEDVSEEDLQNVKNYMTGTFAYTLQNPQTIARFAINTQKYDLPADYYATYLKKVAAVTIADVRRVAQKYIHPEKALILIVGDKEIAPKTALFSAENKVYYYNNQGNPAKDKIKAAAEGVTAESVIEKFVTATYLMAPGKKLNKKLSKIKDVTTKLDASIQGQVLTMVRYQKAPNLFASVMSMGPMTIQKETFNGTVGKKSGMQGDKDITGSDLEELKASSTIFADTKLKELGYTFELKGVEPIEGKDAHKILVTKPGGATETEWYDVASGFKVKTLSIETQGEESFSVITYISDYKEVNGIVLPHSIKVSFGPQSLDMKVTSIEMNQKLSDDLFE